MYPSMGFFEALELHRPRFRWTAVRQRRLYLSKSWVDKAIVKLWPDAMKHRLGNGIAGVRKVLAIVD